LNRFSRIPKTDSDLFQQVQNFLNSKINASQADIKIIAFKKTEPKLTEMKDGDKFAYDDGTNVWRYYRISGKLYKTQLTEV